jgi:xanthine dehydrogenase YagR molybdenum-binding subunit
VTRPLHAAVVSGQPVTRVDGRLKVTGKALYAADNPAPDLVYAALVCSTIARGSVERIDPAAAVRDRDVLRVLSDFGGVKLPYDIQQVSCFGQPVAMVVATTLEAAMHGAALVEVRYRPGPQLTNIDAPRAEQKPGSRTRDYARGDADAALRDAAVVTDLHYSILRNNHNPMEIPATVASWDGDRLTVWDKVQSISGAQKTYADAFGIPGDHVRVISPFVGGAFGSAGTTWPHQLLAAFAARKIRRPRQADADQKAVLQRHWVPPHQPSADGDRRRQIGAHQCHRARGAHGNLTVQRVRGQSDGRRQVPVRLTQYAVDISRCAA